MKRWLLKPCLSSMFLCTRPDTRSCCSFLIACLLVLSNVFFIAVSSKTIPPRFTGKDITSGQSRQLLSTAGSRPLSDPSGPSPNPHSRRFPISFPLRESWWLVVEEMVPFAPDTDAIRAMRYVYSQIQLQTVWHYEHSNPLPLISLNVGPVRLEFSSPAPLSISWLQETFARTMMRLAERGLSGEYRVRFENQNTGVIVKAVLSVAGLGGLVV